jgi:DNA replication protein DnaC
MYVVQHIIHPSIKIINMIESTTNKMRLLQLTAMAQAYHADYSSGHINQYSTSEYIAVLIERQLEYKLNTKTKKLKQAARFRQQASAIDLDYSSVRGIDKPTMLNLLELQFINYQHNIIITGATGTGKSFIAQCIGIQACDRHYKVVYSTLVDLATDMDMAMLKGTYAKWLKKLQDCHLLILDDFGLTAINQSLKKALMEIIDYRYDRSATIIAAQLPISKWHELINDDTIADALLDRLIHKAYKIELKGESMRRLKKI